MTITEIIIIIIIITHQLRPPFPLPIPSHPHKERKKKQIRQKRGGRELQKLATIVGDNIHDAAMNDRVKIVSAKESHVLRLK